MADVTPRNMIIAIVLIFVISILGAAFTPTLQTQVDAWKANLTAEGQTAAATIVGLIPLVFWVLLAVGIILMVVGMFLGGVDGLALLPFALLNVTALMALTLGLASFALILLAVRYFRTKTAVAS